LALVCHAIAGYQLRFFARGSSILFFELRVEGISSENPGQQRRHPISGFIEHQFSSQFLQPHLAGQIGRLLADIPAESIHEGKGKCRRQNFFVRQIL
jgi:hypothetical protein